VWKERNKFICTKSTAFYSSRIKWMDEDGAGMARRNLPSGVLPRGFNCSFVSLFYPYIVCPNIILFYLITLITLYEDCRLEYFTLYEQARTNIYLRNFWLWDGPYGKHMTLKHDWCIKSSACSRNNQHYAPICTTPLFYILDPRYFGSSLPSSGNFLDLYKLLQIQIEWVVEPRHSGTQAT
jgi:hypothetical protein